MRGCRSFDRCRRSPFLRHRGVWGLVVAALLVAGSCEIGHAQQRTNDDHRAEIADLKFRLQRLEKLLDDSRTSASFGPQSAVPPAPAQDGGQSQPARILVAPEEKPKRPLTGRSGNLSTLPRPFQDEDYPTVNWSGFLQLDTGAISQSDDNKAAVGDIDAQTGLRRVRIRVDGFVRKHTEYVIDLDFAAAGHPSFRNVALTFGDIPTVQNMIMGYFKTPFGMDSATGGRELLLLERQLPFAFAPFRQTGVGFFGTDDEQCSTYNVAVFGYPTDSFGVTTANSGGGSISSRFTKLFLYQDGGSRLIHMGVGYSLGDPADNTIRYRIQPGFFVTDPASTTDSSVPSIVDTGAIPARMFHLFNVEMAAAFGAFHLQTEARWSIVDQIGGPTLGFNGAYIQMGLLLTGECPNYDRREAIFRRIIPLNDFNLGEGGGAFELTAGFSHIDLTDKNIHGGQSSQFILGMNWYMTRHTKFVFQFAPLMLDEPDFGDSSAFVASARAQVEF